MSLAWLPALISGAATIYGAKNEKDEGKYSAAMYRTNAGYAEAQADDALARGEFSAMRALSKARSMVGSQRAALAAQGIDISSGSALDVQVDTGRMAEMDIIMIKNNAARESWGFKVQASDLRNRANLAEKTGRNRARTTLLTGGLNTLRLAKGL